MPKELVFKGYALVGEWASRLGTHDMLICDTTDPKDFTNLQVKSFKPKDFEAKDVEIAITHCGVCGSDVHTLKQGWGDTSTLPLVVGHEIIGHAVRVGQRVKDIKVGYRVGVGAQVWSCMQCRQCKDGFENYCPKQVDTYVSMQRFDGEREERY